ncbi:MAG TPA: lantibiotic dehydratase, partial [Cellvibrio sp.]
MATIPYSALNALRLPDTECLIDCILQAENIIEQNRPILEDTMFALVSRLEEETGLRRLVLKLKRQIHSGSIGKFEEESLDLIDDHLKGGERESYRVWREALRQLNQASLSAAISFEQEISEKVRPALRAPLAENLFRSALALASAGVLYNAERELHLPSKPDPDRFERSLFGYLMRAAAKTSPFSSFMALSAIAVDINTHHTPPRVLDNNVRRRVRLNRGVVARLHRAIACTPAVGEKMPLLLNPTFKSIGASRYRALCERNVMLLGRPWREQRRAQFQLHSSVGNAVLQQADTKSKQEWQQHFIDSGVNSDQVGALLDKLLERDVISPARFSDAFDSSPEKSLLEFLDKIECQRLDRPKELIAKMHQLGEYVAANEGIERVRAVAEIEELEREFFSYLEMPPQEPFQNMILEDCWATNVQGTLGSNLLSPISDLQSFLNTQVEVSPLYARLVDYFIEEYGVGGRCEDLTEFLVKYGDKLIERPEYGNAVQQGAARIAPKGATLGVTAQFDVAFDENSKPLIVVNKVYDQFGWLTARFAFGEEKGQVFLRESLRQWLQKVCGHREPVDFIVNGDCNDLQSHPRLTDRVLQWHGEPVTENHSGIISPNELRLYHDTTNNMLELTDSTGKSINLVYLGSTLPTPSWGIPYALSILTQPYRLMRPGFIPPTDSSTYEEVVFTPRLQQGSLVLSRAVWWVRSDYLLRTWFSENGLARMIAVERERRRLNLPRLLFAQAAVMN